MTRTSIDTSLELTRTADAPLNVVNPDIRHKYDANEHTEVVPPEDTAGHSIWIAGDANNPWIWCTIAGHTPTEA